MCSKAGFTKTIVPSRRVIISASGSRATISGSSEASKSSPSLPSPAPGEAAPSAAAHTSGGGAPAAGG